jgi:hypothetical protein
MILETCDNRGIRITTSNGKKFSLQIGYGMYCSNQDRPMSEMLDGALRPKNVSSPDCEVAVFSKDDEWITHLYFDDISKEDQVRGYVPVEDIFRIILAEESMLDLVSQN